MTFKEKVKHIMEIKGVNSKDLASKIGVNESLISKWINKGEPSLGFINHLVNLYPDIDLNYLMKDERPGKSYIPLFDKNLINEENGIYGNEKSPHEIIEEIEIKLNTLKEKLAQNSHKKI